MADRQPGEPTTTHDPEHGGHPRLVMAPRADLWPGDRQEVFPLVHDLTVLGSAEDCDIRLEGLAPRHAAVRHDERDEFVLVPLGAPDHTRVNGGSVEEEALLRTGTRVELGAYTMSFYREEYADHGRPFGGRIGGEAGHQRPQPPRSVVEDRA